MNSYQKLTRIIKNQIKYIERIHISKENKLLMQEKQDFIQETKELLKTITQENAENNSHLLDIIDCEIDLFKEKVAKINSMSNMK
jgi:hypothetical protein